MSDGVTIHFKLEPDISLVSHIFGWTVLIRVVCEFKSCTFLFFQRISFSTVSLMDEVMTETCT